VQYRRRPREVYTIQSPTQNPAIARVPQLPTPDTLNLNEPEVFNGNEVSSPRPNTVRGTAPSPPPMLPSIGVPPWPENVGHPPQRLDNNDTDCGVAHPPPAEGRIKVLPPSVIGGAANDGVTPPPLTEGGIEVLLPDAFHGVTAMAALQTVGAGKNAR
jgi:hypothetical protein